MDNKDYQNVDENNESDSNTAEDLSDFYERQARRYPQKLNAEEM